MIEEIDTMVKENVKSKKILKQNIQEIWYTMKGHIKHNMNRRFLGQGFRKCFQQNVRINFPNVKKKKPINVQEG